MIRPQVVAHRGSSAMHAENTWAAFEAAVIARLREARLAVTLWHEERESELRALVALRPDAIWTNVPALLRRIVDMPATGRMTEGVAANSG